MRPVAPQPDRESAAMDAHAVPVDLYVRHEFPLDVPRRLAVGAWSVRPRPRCNWALIRALPCRARRLALRPRRQMSATAAGRRTGVPFHSLPKGRLSAVLSHSAAT